MEIRAEVREEIDRMTEDEFHDLKKLSATYPDRVEAVLRNARWDTGPETEKERLPMSSLCENSD